MAKSALEKLNAEKSEKKVLMDKDFAGIKAGQMMYVATPKIVAEFIKNIPQGQQLSIPELRIQLAKANQCDATCPVSTAIFIRIAAEASLEMLEQGQEISDIIPFWRVLDGSDKISKKLNIDSGWIIQQRELEQLL